VKGNPTKSALLYPHSYSDLGIQQPSHNKYIICTFFFIRRKHYAPRNTFSRQVSCCHVAYFPSITGNELEHKTETQASNSPPGVLNTKPITVLRKSIASYWITLFQLHMLHTVEVGGWKRNSTAYGRQSWHIWRYYSCHRRDKTMNTAVKVKVPE
jgi:hypothetical protein